MAEGPAAHMERDSGNAPTAEPRISVVQLNELGILSASAGSAQASEEPVDRGDIVDIKLPQVRVNEEATSALSLAISLGIKDYKRVAPAAAKSALTEYINLLSPDEVADFLVMTSVFGDLVKRKYGCECKPTRAWEEANETREGQSTPLCYGVCGEHLRRRIVSVGFAGLKVGGKGRIPEMNRLISRESWDVGCSEQLATVDESGWIVDDEVRSDNPMEDMDKDDEYPQEVEAARDVSADAMDSVLEFLTEKTAHSQGRTETAVASVKAEEVISDGERKERVYSEVLLRRKDEFVAQLQMQPREEGRGTPPPMEKAVQAYREGRLDEAKSLVESIVDASPNDAHALYNAGMIALAVEDNLSAEYYFCRTLSVDPSHWEALWQYGVIYYNREEYIDAKGYISRCVDECPTHPEAYFILGSIWEKLEDISKAVSSYESHLAHCVVDASSRVWLRKYVAFLCMNELDDKERAVNHVMSAAELDQSVEVVSDCVALVISMGATAQAEALLAKHGKSLSGSDEAELGVTIGLAYLSEMNISPGLDLLGTHSANLIESDKKMALFEFLAECHRSMHEMPQAQLYLERAMRLALPGKEDILSFARILHANGKLKESCVIYNSYFDKKTEDVPNEELGRAYADYAAVLLDRLLIIPASVNAKHALEYCPDSEEVMEIALKVFLVSGKEADSQRVVETLIERFSNVKAIDIKAVAHAKKNQLDESRKLWETHIKNTDDDLKEADLRRGYCRFLLLCGHDSMASQQANLADKAFPHNPENIFNIIGVHKAIKNKSTPLPRGLS